jgi:hypothetical protein
MLVKWPVCRSVVVPSVVFPSREAQQIYHQIDLYFNVTQTLQKLPDNGRLLPKHVEVSI